MSIPAPTADEIARFGRYAVERLEAALYAARSPGVSGDEVLSEIERAWMAFRLHCGSPEPVTLTPDPTAIIEDMDDLGDEGSTS